MKPPDRISPPDPDDPFELLEPLGVGGFAHTYRARVIDPELVEEYGTDEIAVKIPLPGKRRALRREIDINAGFHIRLRALRSLNIVRYLGVEAFRGQLVMAMEYVRHGSLRKTLGPISRQKSLPVTEAVEIAEGVLAGLDAIHQEHIFHRDIKPDNIMMDDGTPKLGDLGIARMLESNELASTTTGTLYYMSPEILGPQGADFRSDIWSVGVTLYEMVTGRLPFGTKDTPIKTMVQLISVAQAVSPHEITDQVPKTLSDIILQALKKDSSERFATAVEMRAALKAFREGPEDRVAKEIATIRSTSGTAAGALEASLKDLIARYPTSARAYQELGEFFNGCHHYRDAIATFQHGIESNPSKAVLHLDLALAHRGLGQNEECARCLEKAVTLDKSLERYASLLSTVGRA